MGDKPTSRADLIELAKTLRRRLDTLYTLGSSNDPLMVDQDYRSKHAYWIAELFQRMELPRRIHVRQIHYKLVSQKTPVLQVDGTPYINNSDCFNRLCDSIRDARYLDLIPADVIIDRRNPDPTINLEDDSDVAAEVAISGGSIERHRFGGEYTPPTITMPGTWLQEPEVGQRYHLEIWIEKSTANEVILPLGREYAINIATFIGEVSATACKNLVDRATASGRPVRVLHVTDFDPAGRDMPISAAVKIDFFAKKSGVGDLDIRLEHVALTEEQCVRYRLPRTPIKETEGRAASFEARYGTGATELDALEALHPGALRQILVEQIERYYDADLDDDVDGAVDRFKDELDSAEALIEEQFSEQLADIDDQRERIAAAFERVRNPARVAYVLAVRQAEAAYDLALAQVRDEIDEMEDRLVKQAETMLAQMKAALEEAVPDPDLFDWPEPAEAEDDDALYDSTRSYVEQVDIFRKHRGDDDDVGLALDRSSSKPARSAARVSAPPTRAKSFAALAAPIKVTKTHFGGRDDGPSQAK